jgi:hypothetical protein
MCVWGVLLGTRGVYGRDEDEGIVLVGFIYIKGNRMMKLLPIVLSGTVRGWQGK